MDPTEIVEQYYPQLFRSSFLLTGNREEAEDLAQEAILRALDAWKKFNGRSSRKTWVYGILLNVHRSKLRGERRRWERILSWFDLSQSRPDPETPVGTVMQREWKSSLWKAVSQLPAVQQQALMLRFYESLSYAEIAEVMGCPIGTVKSRLNAGLSRLGESTAVQELAQLVIENG